MTLKINDNVKYFVDLLVIGVTLIAVLGLVSYARPLVIAPVDSFETLNTTVLFSFEKGTALLVDDNLQFTSPEVIQASNNVSLSLGPGVYYWKVDGVIGSQVRQITVNSIVGIALRENNNSYDVVNTGNVPLDVDVYSNGSFVRKLKIAPERQNTSDGDKFVGSQNG